MIITTGLCIKDTTEQRGQGDICAALEQFPGVVTLCGHVHWPTPLVALSTDSQVLNIDGRATLLRFA